MAEKQLTKVCSSCKSELDISMFNKNKRLKDGHSYMCKTCKKIYDQKSYNKHIEKRKSKKRIYYLENSEAIKRYQESYRQNNHEKIKLRDSLYRKNNKENKSASDKEYRAKNRDKLIEKSKKHYLENKQKYIDRAVAYFKTEKGKISKRNIQQARRSIMKKGTISTEDMEKLLFNAKKCYWCLLPLSNNKKHIDHYIPLINGGEHSLENVVVSCPKCNHSKGSKDPIDFANKAGRLF